MVKNVCFLLLIYWFLSFAVFTQQGADKSAARLFDEYDNFIAASDKTARLDFAITSLQSEANTKVFIVTNRFRSQLPGETVRALNWTKLYLTRYRGFNAERIVLVDGGTTSCPKTQIWLTPSGTTPKIEKNTYEQNFGDDKMPQKFDEYYFSSDKLPSEFDYNYSQGSVSSLKEFVAEVRKKKHSSAYVIVYPQYETRYIKQTDSPSAATIMSRNIRNDLINKHKLASSKVNVINGGYRRLRQVELWILPRGVHPPVATPNVFPKTNRKRQN